MIEKERMVANPASLEEAIRQNWKMKALPAAWAAAFEVCPNDMVELMRKILPSGLEIKDEEILEFLRKLTPRSESGAIERHGLSAKGKASNLSGPDAWERLLSPDDAVCARHKEAFGTGYERNLGCYIISDTYKPWNKKSTWKHAKMPSDEHRIAGAVIGRFKKWGFIEYVKEIDGYKRVEEGVPYLKKLLEG